MGRNNFWTNEGQDGQQIDWASTISFTTAQVCWYNSSFYEALQDSLNKNPEIEPTYWQKRDISSNTEWNGGITYSIGNIVWYSTSFWKSLVGSNLGNTPVEGINWTNIGSLVSSELPQTFDISATDEVQNLPVMVGDGKTKTFDWHSGDGSNTFSAVPDGTEKIRFDDGTEVSSLIGQGNGSMTLQDVGTHWKVISYIDSGSNSDGNFKKEVDGTLICNDSLTSVSVDIDGASNGFFRTGGGEENTNYAHAFVGSAPHTSPVPANANCSFITNGGGGSLTAFNPLFWRGDNAGVVSVDYSYSAIGRWRT